MTAVLAFKRRQETAPAALTEVSAWEVEVLLCVHCDHHRTQSARIPDTVYDARAVSGWAQFDKLCGVFGLRANLAGCPLAAHSLWTHLCTTYTSAIQSRIVNPAQYASCFVQMLSEAETRIVEAVVARDASRGFLTLRTLSDEQRSCVQAPSAAVLAFTARTKRCATA